MLGPHSLWKLQYFQSVRMGCVCGPGVSIVVYLHGWDWVIIQNGISATGSNYNGLVGLNPFDVSIEKVDRNGSAIPAHCLASSIWENNDL